MELTVVAALRPRIQTFATITSGAMFVLIRKHVGGQQQV